LRHLLVLAHTLVASVLSLWRRRLHTRDRPARLAASLDILALCPFSVGALIWEAMPSQWSLTVCVKATFTLVDGGESEIAPMQDAICDDRRWDKDPGSSLFSPDDLAPLKSRVDVLLVGHAYAPGGVPVPSLVASLRVGDLAKSVRVTGDRAWVAQPGGLLLRMPPESA